MQSHWAGAACTADAAADDDDDADDAPIAGADGSFECSTK
jgi:hypothetical protein